MSIADRDPTCAATAVLTPIRLEYLEKKCGQRLRTCHHLAVHELVRPNMRLSVVFAGSQALVGTEMRHLFAFLAERMAARGREALGLRNAVESAERRPP